MLLPVSNSNIINQFLAQINIKPKKPKHMSMAIAICILKTDARKSHDLVIIL